MVHLHQASATLFPPRPKRRLGFPLHDDKHSIQYTDYASYRPVNDLPIFAVIRQFESQATVYDCEDNDDAAKPDVYVGYWGAAVGLLEVVVVEKSNERLEDEECDYDCAEDSVGHAFRFVKLEESVEAFGSEDK
jgi:hypothetical protein